MEVRDLESEVKEFAAGNPVTRSFSADIDKSLMDDTGEVILRCSTKSPDRMGDRVYPDGGKVKTNLKLLYGHNKNDLKQLLGTINKTWHEGDKLFIKAKFNSSENGQLARALIKEGSLDEASISFIPGEYKFNEERGVDFITWEWVECSLVPTPAHRDTGVISVKSIEPKEEKPKEIDVYKEHRVYALTVIHKLLRDKPEDYKQLIRDALIDRGYI